MYFNYCESNCACLCLAYFLAHDIKYCSTQAFRHWPCQTPFIKTRVVIGIKDGVLLLMMPTFTSSSEPLRTRRLTTCFQVGLAAVNKKKLSHHIWQMPGFSPRRDFNLSDVPKNICFVRNSVIIGYKKFYECLDLNSGVTSRILDVEKENKMIILEVNDRRQ